MEKRLTDLEIRYMHLERQLEELNQVVVEQQKTIDRMAKELSGLVGRLRDLGDEVPIEKPPHF